MWSRPCFLLIIYFSVYRFIKNIFNLILLIKPTAVLYTIWFGISINYCYHIIFHELHGMLNKHLQQVMGSLSFSVSQKSRHMRWAATRQDCWLNCLCDHRLAITLSRGLMSAAIRNRRALHASIADGLCYCCAPHQ